LKFLCNLKCLNFISKTIYTVSQKDSQHFSCNSSKHYLIFINFGKALLRNWTIKSCFISHLTWIVFLHYLAKYKRRKNASFQLNTVCWFAKKTCKTPFIKQSIVCIKLDQNHEEMEQSIQRSVSCRISIYQVHVCRGFGWQLGISTMEVFFYKPVDSTTGYPNVSHYQTHCNKN